MGCLQPINCGGKNVVPEVWEVLDKIKGFSDKVRLQGSLLVVPACKILSCHSSQPP